MRTMHLFAGIGGGLLADLILGHQPIVAVEWDKYACRVLRQRAADGWFPGLHVWEGDVRLFDPSEYDGSVDCIHAGFPCQDISVAGKQAGVSDGTRSGLYREVLRIAGIVRPRYLFLENVAAILSNGLGTVLADLAAMGYDTRWCCIRASDVWAPHHRDRWFLLADADIKRTHRGRSLSEQDRRNESSDSSVNVADAYGYNRRSSCMGQNSRADGRDIACGCGEVLENSKRNDNGTEKYRCETDWPQAYGPAGRTCGSSWWATVAGLGELADGLSDRVCEDWWEVEPEIGRVAKGVDNRVGQLKGYGNAQVPLQAAAAWRLLGGQ